MNFNENFRLALRALAANKMRSILTMLGIIIGVGSVVALMAIGTGATAGITQQVQALTCSRCCPVRSRPGRATRAWPNKPFSTIRTINC
jgi:putative ABC transport system permease protein